MTEGLRPGVLFDVDGTLVDANYLHTLAWSRAFRDAGEWAPMNAIHRLVGMGGDQLVPRLLGHDSPDAVAARPRRYQELVGDIRPFPAPPSCSAGSTAAVWRSCWPPPHPDGELQTLRQTVDADDAIDGQTTADDIGQSKPAPEVFLTAMANCGVDARQALAVGDSIWDVQAARAAGVGCIAVETGGFSQHELSEAGSLQVYRDVARATRPTPHQPPRRAPPSP